MDCRTCHELLSDFLDNSLTAEMRRAVSMHTQTCSVCAAAREELETVIAFAAGDFAAHEVAPPDKQALWLRINEQVENDVAWARVAPKQVHAGESWWRKLWKARWEVTAPRAAFACVALVASVSASVMFGITNVQSTLQQRADKNLAVEGNSMLPARVVRADERVRARQAEMQYLMRRIESRKNRFTPRLRQSYEQSLASLDQTVNQSLDSLRRNPEDRFSEQMIDTALRERVELLREFSEF